MRRERFRLDDSSEIRLSEKQLLVELICIAGDILRELRELNSHNVTGGTIRRIGDSPMSTSFPTLGPGVTAKFQVTPTEASGVVDESTLAAQTAWTSSDPTNFPVVTDPTDPSGDTADVTIPQAETTTETVTLTWTYTNADGTTATASASFDLVGGVVTPVDVTGGTIERIA